MVVATPNRVAVRTGTPSKARTASPARSATPPKAGGATPSKAGTPAKKAPPPSAAAAAGKGAKKRPPQPPKPGEFIACKTFDGPRSGMVFTNGVHGVGYYKDARGCAGGSGLSERSGGGGTAPTSAASSERELDAAEVFATLPLSMQVAFEARDINALDAALSALPPEEAEVHMQRCIASGLWDPSGAGANAEQEPSPTGDSDTPVASDGYSGGAEDDAGAPAPNVAAEEEAAAAEASALAERNGSNQSDLLFERGPYRNGGAQSDAPKGKAGAAGAAAVEQQQQQQQQRPPSSSAKKGGAAGGGKAAGTPGSSNGSKPSGARGAGASAEVERRLAEESQARAAAEGELARMQTQVQRLLTKLDEAERFKSDEARAITAAREVQQRLQDENAALRALLAEKGTSEQAIADALSTAAAPAAGGADAANAAASDSSAAAPPAPFDAEKEAPEAVPEICFPPSSLDPDVVLASLPTSMQNAFDALDVAALHAALAALPPAEASEYMRRCVASGLWDPNGSGSAVDAS